MIAFFARLVREMAQPALKCDRVGHRTKTFERKGYRRASWPFVAERVVQTATVCRRCGAELVKNDTVVRGLSALTLPTSWMDTLSTKGEVWCG